MFAIQEELSFDGSPKVAAMSVGQCCSSHLCQPSPKSGVETLYTMVADPDAPIADISRLIAVQIAGILVAMADERPTHRQASQRYLNDQVQVYRELQRTLTESDALSNRDTLDLDGPKFKFILTEIVRLFRQALKDAGIPESLAQNAMLQFGDLIKEHDERLCIAMKKVAPGVSAI
jgi:hypothetical protein